MKTKSARNFLIALLAFLGLGAIGGGGVLIISPGGELIGMPLSMLDHSPFNNFFLPGIILFSILGIAPLLLIVALNKKPGSKLAERFNFFSDMHWSWTYSIYVAFALIFWITNRNDFSFSSKLAAYLLYVFSCCNNFCCLAATGENTI
ncbi:MAG: hypothetical protein SGI89_06395 [bacterium]|nr:hypothetical protein [bacterium]